MSAPRAGIVSFAEYKPEKLSRITASKVAAKTRLETCADLALQSQIMRGLTMQNISGVSFGACCRFSETYAAVPLTVAEYLGDRRSLW
jgi:hypothetical protein